MSLLDKFFGNGAIRNKRGEYTGRIEHVSEHDARIYDTKNNYVGRIESYGDDVKLFDKSGYVTSVGTRYGESDYIDTYSYTGGESKRYKDVGDYSVSSDILSNDYEYGSIYMSDDSEEDNSSDVDSFW